MSAASVAPPMTTTYIQAPGRFASPTKRANGANPSPTQRMYQQIAATQRVATPTQRAGTPQRGSTPSSQPQQSRVSPSPSRAQPRVNPNYATSAGFPLAMTAVQKAEIAQRKLEERLEWEDQHYAAAAEAQAEAEAAMAKEESDAAQNALYKRHQRDPKIPYRQRAIPPRPNHPEDPLTARASEHTGIYWDERRVDRPLTGFSPDVESAAPEGSSERAEQRRRTNPLLDPLYTAKSDAAGLGYGRTHRAHFRYISHWSSNDTSQAATDLAAASLTADAARSGQTSTYRSKDGRPYDPSIRSMGWGAPHDTYNQYISVRRADDVLKDYPSREACEKLLHKSW